MNPKATTATERTCDVLVGALSSALDLRTVRTERRGHAAELARDAAEEGVDVVIAFGGDGTVNEVVTGLLADGPGLEVPALAVVPGGSTNVFARALGLPNHAVEATGALLRLLREQRTRLVSMGAAYSDGESAPRYFTFSAGYGFDAAVVGAVERQRAEGRRSTGALYIRSALAEYFRNTDRRTAPISVTLADGTELPPLFMAVLANTAPWTYLGSRPILATPEASFMTGLDLFGLSSMSALPVWRTVGRLIANSRRLGDGRGVLIRHDLPELTLSAQRPVEFQVDGDYLGPRERVTFRSVPDALRVFA
ncbi:diacylglycerol kinase family protein [Actinocrinis sp.]|uniref:diacylglycerol/lipid kinase family protein n=1 Tax=Actinocrinis sp. TaxID=1920516 RepID=UPI0032C21608